MTEKFGFLRAGYLRHRRGGKGFLSVVALFDLVFLTGLYVFVHSAFVLQPGIKIRLPDSAFTAGASYHDMVVTLVEEDIVFFNDERTSLAGLGELFKAVAEERPGTGILLEADARVRNETLVRIYNMAQAAGINEITLATGLLMDAEPQP